MRTGVVDVVGRRLLALTNQRPRLLLPATMVAVAALSAVINNTAAAAFFLPVVLGMSQRSGRSGDHLLTEGSSEAILRVKELAEVVLLPGSPFIGRRPRGLQMRERYQIQVFAISRRTGVLRSRIADTPMRLGDVLLVQGAESHIAALQADKAFDVLGVVQPERLERRKAALVVAIFVLALTLGTLASCRWRPRCCSARCWCSTGVITLDDAYRQIEWRILVLIGSMLC